MPDVQLLELLMLLRVVKQHSCRKCNSLLYLDGVAREVMPPAQLSKGQKTCSIILLCLLMYQFSYVSLQSFKWLCDISYSLAHNINEFTVNKQDYWPLPYFFALCGS